VRGLWYFFGIVVAAGIFAGTAGLGLGYVGGILWEQNHRLRRRKKLEAKARAEAPVVSVAVTDSLVPTPVQPRLQLVSVESFDLPIIDGRVMRSVQFRAQSIELDVGGIRLSLTGNPAIVCRGQRFRYPEPGARDALCSLIGDRVHSVRAPSNDRVEVTFDSGCELVMLRSAVAVA
jgi:hypothetical protein